VNAHGDFYRRTHNCPCGSGLIGDWCKDEAGNEVRACEKCKIRLLYRIFEKRHREILEQDVGTTPSGPRSLDYELRWQNLMNEKGCVRVVGLEEAKRQRQIGQILIRDPNGDTISPVYAAAKDRSVHILISRDYAATVLANGMMA
jgi:hypothetical protein